MHHGMKKLFNNGYAEDIWDEIDENELTAIVGDPTQLQEMDNFYMDNAMNKWALDVKEVSGVYPSKEEFISNREKIRQELLSQKDMRFPEIKKSIAKGMDTMFEFDLTQEAFDNKGRFDALTALKNDQTSTKSKAKIEDEILLMQGLNPRQFDKSQEELLQEQAVSQAQDTQAQEELAPPSPLTA